MAWKADKILLDFAFMKMFTGWEKKSFIKHGYLVMIIIRSKYYNAMPDVRLNADIVIDFSLHS